MKGMLIKDFRLLKNQGRNLLIMLLIVAAFMNLITDVGPSFAAGYITIIFSLFTVSTISYDEFDNCYLFLMTLPVSRKKYVDEKYLFAFLSILAAWCIGMILGTGIMFLERPSGTGAAEWAATCLGYIFAAWICVGIMIPLRLKFEAEKARYVNLILVAGVIAAAFSASKFIGYLPEEITDAGQIWIDGLSAGSVLGVSAGITAVIVIISYMVSRHIMAEKEF